MLIPEALARKARTLRASYNRSLRAKGRPTLAPLAPALSLSLHDLARELRTRLLGSRGNNEKLGALYAWSLLAVETCPWRTDACEGPCYARRNQARRPAVWLAWFRCYELSLHPLFREALALALSSLPEGILRVHVSGDFYSAKYLADWLSALEATPHIRPFAFTRSWRGADIRTVLTEWEWPAWILASTDGETGRPPIEMREAGMASVSKHAALSGKAATPKDACPEQTGKASSCGACGRCPMAQLSATGIRPIPAARHIGVTFLVH